jgi:hypothetical protein
MKVRSERFDSWRPIKLSALFLQQVLGYTTCDVHVDCIISLTLKLSNFYFINAPSNMKEVCDPLFFITILQNGCGKHLKFGVKGSYVLKTLE